MFESLISIFTSSGLGAIVGAVGSWATKRENRKMRQLEFGHELSMANIDITQSRMEYEHALLLADKNIEQAQVEGEIATDIAEIEAFAESLKVQRAKSGVKIVDSIRFLMRPVITAYLLLIVTYFAYNIHAVVDGLEAFSATELIILYTQLISQMMFLTTTAVTWWFGSRGSASK